MRKIKLVPVLDFGHRAEYTIMDVTDNMGLNDSGKKRGTISVDYTPQDIKSLQEQGMDLDAALDYYKAKIYDMVKVLISGDWEDMNSLDAAVETVKSHIASRF